MKAEESHGNFSSESQLDSVSAAELWESAADAVDEAALSGLAVEDRSAQPLIPAIVAVIALKALAGVFCAGVFKGLGVDKQGEKVGKKARDLLAKLRRGEATAIDEAQVTREVEGWVAEARAQEVSASTVAAAEQAVADLLTERGEDPEQALTSARAFARAILRH